MNVIRRWRRVLLGLLILCAAFAGPARIGWTAEATRFLVSYGGTAGYQLPLWVNKELGFSKRYGLDLEIILIQAGSPNIQALLGGSLQLTQTAASSAVIGASQGAPVVIVATLEISCRCCSSPVLKLRSRSSCAAKSSVSTGSVAPTTRPC